MASQSLRYSHLTTQQLRVLLRFFPLEVPVNRAARELGVNRHTVERIYTVIVVRWCGRAAHTLGLGVSGSRGRPAPHCGG
jgi:hypothetical protein